MKKNIIMGLLLASLLSTSITASAISNKITDSGHYLVNDHGIYAVGYTESESYHYTTARLYEGKTDDFAGKTTYTSERKWGTGNVFQRTTAVERKTDYEYASAVYYGFK